MSKAKRKTGMMKPLLLVLVCLGLLFGIDACTPQRNVYSRDLESLALRTDVNPLAESFPLLSSSSECYWKADIIGRNSIGPSNYFITGFVVLDDKTFEEVTNGYAFVNEVPTFPAGMNPSVTSRTHFAWGANEEFTHELLGASFIGTVYFDSINGMVFFDVQNL